MKPSEMTNEQIAEELMATIPHISDAALACTDAADILREAAARLRNVTVRSDNSAVIAELQRRLKVAEDALSECRGFAERYEVDDDYMMSDICSDVRGTVRNALATIREEGGEK